MSKVVISIAERLKQLRQIPENMLPSTLTHKITLPKFTEMKIEHNQRAK